MQEQEPATIEFNGQAPGVVRAPFDPKGARNIGLAFDAVPGLSWVLRALLRH